MGIFLFSLAQAMFLDSMRRVSQGRSEGSVDDCSTKFHASKITKRQIQKIG